MDHVYVAVLADHSDVLVAADEDTIMAMLWHEFPGAEHRGDLGQFRDKDGNVLAYYCVRSVWTKKEWEA